jgi:hypothetical protein
MWVDWKGPGYSPRIVRTTFDLMEAWIKDGTRPEAGEVVGK